MTDSTPQIPIGAMAASNCGEGSDCEKALRDLYRYLDGEMTDDRCADIKAHIDACGPCLEAFDFESELRELVARTCRCEAPGELRDRVADAIRQCADEPETPPQG